MLTRYSWNIDEALPRDDMSLTGWAGGMQECVCASEDWPHAVKSDGEGECVQCVDLTCRNTKGA